jgi:hypothetical protein
VGKELTNYESWQLEKYGDILQPVESMPLADIDFFEAGSEELARREEWLNLQYERQLWKDEFLHS